MMAPGDRSRRQLLFGATGLATVLAAGCLGDGDSDDGDDNSDVEGDVVDDTANGADDSSTGEPGELPTDPTEDDYVDRSNEDTVEVVTREGGDDEPEFLFDPPFVAVDPGTTVRWVNDDGVFHTVTSIPALDERQGGRGGL